MSLVIDSPTKVGRLRLGTTPWVLSSYLVLLLVGLFFVIIYGFLQADAMPREGTWLLRWRSVLAVPRDAGISPLLVGRTLSLVVTSIVLCYCLWTVRRRIGWYGVGVFATILVSSPIIAILSTSATPDSLLLAALVLPLFSMWAGRMAVRSDSASMGRWCFVGLVGLLGLGLSGLADILCGKGKIEHFFTNNDPWRIGLSMIMVGCAIYTLMVGTALAAVGQRWADGRVSSASAGWWQRGLAFLSIRVPMAALVLVIYRMLREFSAMERVHIITACAWVALVWAIVQVRLRHWEGQFFPILLVAIAVKIVWVHALVRERDIERGSAMVARAVARSIPSGGALEGSIPVDSVFAYTLWAETRPSEAGDSYRGFVLDERSPLLPADLVATFQVPRRGPVYLVRRSEPDRLGDASKTLR
jgi:hypothetical protein